jgi:hypothetical protein
MQSILLNSGKVALAKAIAEGKKLKIAAYRIGAAANFIPTPDAINPNPTSIYQGSSDFVSSSLINEDEIRYTITLLETVGQFNVGNVMLYLGEETSGAPILIPYLWGVLPAPLPKYKQDGTKSVGNRIVLNVIAKYTNVSEAFELKIIPPALASLPNVASEDDLPPPQLAVHQNYVIQNNTATGAPSLALRRNVDDVYYLNTFFQRIDDPLFGSLIGGVVGDSYAPFFGVYKAGGLFKHGPSAFNDELDGGEAWSVPGTNDLPVDGGSF